MLISFARRTYSQLATEHNVSSSAMLYPASRRNFYRDLNGMSSSPWVFLKGSHVLTAWDHLLSSNLSLKHTGEFIFFPEPFLQNSHSFDEFFLDI